MPLPCLTLQLQDAETQQLISDAHLLCISDSSKNPRFDELNTTWTTPPLATGQHLFQIDAKGYETLHYSYLVEFKSNYNAIQRIALIPHPTTHWNLMQRMEWIRQRISNRPLAVKPFASPAIYHCTTPTALLTLLAELSLIPPNGTTEIYLTAGNWYFEHTLQLAANIHLIGAAEGKTHLQLHAPAHGIAIRGLADKAITNVCLRQLHITHQGGNCFATAILITQAQNIELIDIALLNPSGTGILVCDHVRNIQFKQCHVQSAGLTGFMFVRDVQDVTLSDCSAEYCLQSGVFLTDLKLPPQTDALDFDRQIYHTIEEIGNFAPFAADDPFVYRTHLINCRFRYNRKMGITTDGVGQLNIHQCVIAYNDCEGITLDNGSFYCQISDCHIYANGRRGLQHDIELTADFVEKMGLLADGSSKAKLPGISLDNAAYCQIHHNQIESNWGDGIKCVRAVYQCHISDNLIAHNNQGQNDRFHFFGILIGVAERQHPEQADFPSCNNVVKHNTILGKHYSGIHLLKGTKNNVLHDNTIQDFLHWAIEDHTL